MESRHEEKPRACTEKKLAPRFSVDRRGQHFSDVNPHSSLLWVHTTKTDNVKNIPCL